MRKIERKIVLVTRATRLAGLVARHATAGQAKFKMVRAKLAAPRARAAIALAEQVQDDLELKREAEEDFEVLREEDASYSSTISNLRGQLAELAPVHVLDRQYLPNYVFGPEDVVVTVGQDGLVANTAKYALGRPIVAVNPDPATIDGILLPFTVAEAPAMANKALRGEAPVRWVTLAEAVLLDGQRILAFNDLFIGARTHVSARYRIEFGGENEAQSSSGVIVSTGAGSTGWLSSILNMPGAIAQLWGTGGGRQKVLKLGWDDPRLVFVTREPFKSKQSGIGLTSGIIQPAQELIVESAMSREGVIFSDGIEADFLDFNAGAIARIRAAKDRALLVAKNASP